MILVGIHSTVFTLFCFISLFRYLGYLFRAPFDSDTVSVYTSFRMNVHNMIPSDHTIHLSLVDIVGFGGEGVKYTLAGVRGCHVTAWRVGIRQLGTGQLPPPRTTLL